MGSSTSSSTSSARPDQPELAVVIVNYRSWGDVAPLVGSLDRSELVRSGTCEVVVVDNASGQPIPESIRTPEPGVRLILQANNGGFSSGVNAGWRASRAPWLLVLNPDLIAEADLLDRVVDRIRSLEQRDEPIPGVVGFALKNPDGSRQPSVGIFPTLLRTLWEQVLPRAQRKYQPDWRLRAGPVDWVTGACFLVASALLDEVGGMDEDFFLYYEEVALCREATRRGWSVEYDPTVAVVHLRPLQNRSISARMRVITRHSKLLYFRKHLPGWQFTALALGVGVEAKIRACWCRVRGQPGARAWQTVGAITRRLRSGENLRGREVLALADSTEDSAADDEGGPRKPQYRRATRRASAANRR